MRAELENPARGVDLVLYSERHARARASVAALRRGSETDLGDIVLGPGGALRGLVVHASGAPLDAAAVLWRREDEQPLARARRWIARMPPEAGLGTDEDGCFELVALAPLGESWPRWNGRRVQGAGGAESLELSFSEAPSFGLAIVDDQSLPVHPVSVSLHPESRAHAQPTRELESSDFTLGAARQPSVRVHAPPGRFTIEVHAPLCAPALLGPFDSAELPALVRCELERVPGLRGLVRSRTGRRWSARTTSGWTARSR